MFHNFDLSSVDQKTKTNSNELHGYTQLKGIWKFDRNIARKLHHKYSLRIVVSYLNPVVYFLDENGQTHDNKPSRYAARI